MKQHPLIATVIGLILFAHSSLAASRDFQLKDFSGDWVFHSTSVGGLGAENGPGIASAVLRKISVDTKGVGKETNGTYVFYLPDGSLKEYKEVSGEIITIGLTDPANGAGTIIVQDSTSFKATSTYNFIAIRNRAGVVTQLHLIMVDTTSSKNSIVVTGVAERQIQN